MRMLEGEKVTKFFGGLSAVFNVDFHINQDEIVGLIGPNGAGKTTLFNLISGAHIMTSGTTKFKGKDITGLKPNKICKRGIARTFQLIKLFGNMTVFDNVYLASLFGLSEKIKKPEARRESLERYLQRLEALENVANSFSGVEKSYAIQAGREIRIMVEGEKVSDDESVILCRDIAKKIEKELAYPGQIKVMVIRETRTVDYAK